MKLNTTIFAACAVTALSLGSAIAGTPTYFQTSTVDEKVETQTIHLEIKGMTWGKACVKKVQSALTKVKGVSAANVTMPDKAEVTAAKDVDIDDLIKAVKAAGYIATKKKETIEM